MQDAEGHGGGDCWDTPCADALALFTHELLLQLFQLLLLLQLFRRHEHTNH
jgi:hypothetical protein